MRIVRWTALALFGAGLFLACTGETPTPIETVAPDGARIVRSEVGALTAPVSAPHDVVVRDFLRTRGAAIDGLRVTRATPPRNGVSHLRMEQTVSGQRVIGAYVKAAVSEQGELLHLIDKVVPVSGAITPARVGERGALRSAMQHLGYEVPTPSQAERKGNLTRFASDKVFYRAPTVERVVYVDELGTARSGFMVETWSQRENQLDETLVGGDGAIVSVERRTNNESYNVFTEDPDKGAQTVVVGNNWLGGGAQYTTNISGPNVRAYLDVDNNNAPDTASTAVTNGDFLAVADLDAQPSTTGNREVAVQNLFYLNNLLHDVLALQGFTVAEGNFEGNDPVNAEAQDGSGTDNANFSTPNDGSSPRMQMFLWSGSDPEGLVTVGSAPFGAYGAGFGPALTLAGVSGALTDYNDGVGVGSDACQTSLGSLTGKIALVDRGTCDFTTKVLNAQKAGAIGVVVANNVTGRAFAMGGTERRIKIPAGMVTLEHGALLRGLVGSSAKLGKNPIAPLMVDGDLDADIVFHEYGHGLTWRMIGSMSGPLAGAIGEGASDVLAFTLNGDDIIGEYSYSDANGIRRAPYDTYLTDTGLTYGDVNGAEVHNDGEIYAAAMWRVRTLYLNAGIPSSELLYDFVQGMNFTPAAPSFESMRDGMLAATETRAPNRACLIWNGFAKYGIGVGAKGTVGRRSSVQITESFALPTGCPNLN